MLPLYLDQGEQMTDHRYFQLGWAFGKQYGPASPRQAIVWLGGNDHATEHQVVLFCNGSDDGAGKDRFRLRLMAGESYETLMTESRTQQREKILAGF